MHRIAEVPIEVDLGSFTRWLSGQRVDHRISEERGMQVLWIGREELGPQVRDALRAYLEDPAIHQRVDDFARDAIDVVPFNPWHRFRPTPITAPLTHLTLIFTLAIFLSAFTAVGELLYRLLMMVDPARLAGALVDGADAKWALLRDSLLLHPWRWLTPSFLHFSVIHLAFNGVLFWLLGGQVEAIEGRGRWLAILLLASLLGNGLQYWHTGPVFGGLSGVVYGLVGYVWAVNRRRAIYLYPPLLFRVAVIWLLIGFTPLPEVLLGVNMANAAHLGGLLAGLLLALLPVRPRGHSV